MSRFLLQYLCCRPQKLPRRSSYSMDQRVATACAVIERCWTSSLNQQNFIQIESVVERKCQDGKVFSMFEVMIVLVLQRRDFNRLPVPTKCISFSKKSGISYIMVKYSHACPIPWMKTSLLD